MSVSVLLNPALSDERKNEIESLLLEKEFEAPHLWISTSGSFAKEGVSKWAALSQKALDASAVAVNAHIEATRTDIWLNPLPMFHVGGLGIQYRARLTGAKAIDFTPKWSSNLFHAALHDSKATLTALVPTQLFDLIVKELPAPKTLRAVIIGGGALDETLYFKARALGWNVLPSYGMTEAASQIATAPLDSLTEEKLPCLQLLPHIEAKTDEFGVLKIKSPSLLTAYGVIENGQVVFYDPKKEGILTTSDRAEVSGRNLSIHGRVDDIVKILGENVDVAKLQKKLDSLKLAHTFQGDFYLAAVPDQRSVNALCLFYTSSEEEAKMLTKHFNDNVFPFERITRSEKREFLPKTPLGKIERNKL